MTGLERLKAEMLKRGCTKNQIESRMVGVILDIIANSESAFTDLQGVEVQLAHAQRELNDTLWKTKIAREDLQREKQEFYAEREDLKKYIDDFNKSLMECETPEAKDTMRVAQMFVNTVRIDTKYDNTAFIIGLAAILSKGGISSPIDELRQINSKLLKNDTITMR